MRDPGELLLLGALQGATLEVRSRLAPPILVELSTLVGGKAPGPFVTALQPTIVLRRGDDVLLMSSPAGEAAPDAWLIGLVVATAVVLLLVLLALA